MVACQYQIYRRDIEGNDCEYEIDLIPGRLIFDDSVLTHVQCSTFTKTYCGAVECGWVSYKTHLGELSRKEMNEFKGNLNGTFGSNQPKGDE